MAGPSSMASNRLFKEFMQLKQDPVPYITAALSDSNILECHYVIEGPPDSPYLGGYYHGKLVFPPEYPFKPPSIYMTTPNGRFQVNKRLCLSISDYHPNTWNPAWSIGTILVGLLSFMLETTTTVGSIVTSTEEKKHLAEGSWRFNLKNETFCHLFPEITQRLKSLYQNKKKTLTSHASTVTTNNVALKNNLVTYLGNLQS